jgi:hypothetical protein
LHLEEDETTGEYSGWETLSVVMAFIVKAIITFFLLGSTAMGVKYSFDLTNLQYNNDDGHEDPFLKDKQNYDDQQYLAVNSITNQKNQKTSWYKDIFRNINLQYLSNLKVDLGLNAANDM